MTETTIRFTEEEKQLLIDAVTLYPAVLFKNINTKKELLEKLKQ